MSFKDAMNALREHIWEPEDYTDCVWEQGCDWVTWYDGDDSEDAYYSDRFRNVKEKDGYLIGTLDDGCGGRYQAIFDLSKEVK